jgi:osmotically-inducible protein OsmY
LGGSVANDAQKAKAENVARSVEGVKNVKNQLTIAVMSPPIK